jgi:hypothetical protein
MPRNLPSLIVIAGLTVLMTPPAVASANAGPRCASGGVTLAATAQVRVSSTGRSKLDRVSVCGLRTGRTTELGDYGTCVRASQIDKRMVIAGKYLAVSGFACPESAIRAWVAVYDADSGKAVRRAAVSGAASGDDVDEQVTSLVLTPGGSVAWIAQRNRGKTVRREVARARAGRETVVLGRAAGITACSLTLSGSRLNWLDRDVMRAATL